MRHRIFALVAAAAIAVFAWWLPRERRSLIKAIVTYDARPSEPSPLPAGAGPGLTPVQRTRVVLIDGLSKSTAATLPAWKSVCARGVTMTVEAGFPTVSLPVEVALWTGLTQQQTGVVYRSGQPLVPPLDRKGIPAQVPGSWAVAESYGYIVRSLGFAKAEPAADPQKPAKDIADPAWATTWEQRALEAVTSPSALVFVHVLRVDTAGHKHGMNAEYVKAAGEADAILGRLVAADPDARWFVLSDHGHRPAGGHGGEEEPIRHVQGCIAGPGVPVATAPLVHVVDVSRALADSVGATLDPAARGRPLSAAIAAPLAPDQGVPPLALGAGAIAIFILVAGVGASSWAVRRWWLAPWWFVVAGACLIAMRGEPSLSTPMIYKPEGRDMWTTFVPGLVLAVAATWVGMRRTTLVRLLVAQLAVPIGATAATITVSGAWPTLFGAKLAPVVPRFTAWMSPLLLLLALGSAAIALGLVASVVTPLLRRRPAEPAS
ncbi:MAG TPA: alkaline phosphatase family protein [Kofleriaceae bacterium]|nr:alkaline phosphatase family protein [Kofleriaceae bacterium]